MNTAKKYAGSIRCNCDHYAPSERVIRSTAFNKELATYIDQLDLSGDGTVDWVLNELFDYRTGKLFGLDGKPLMIDVETDLTDELFGAEQRRFVNRYKARAHRKFRYRLQMRMVWPVLAMHFAREIHSCRMEGSCSNVS